MRTHIIIFSLLSSVIIGVILLLCFYSELFEAVVWLTIAETVSLFLFFYSLFSRFDSGNNGHYPPPLDDYL